MTPYWLLFGLWMAGALQTERNRDQRLRQIFFIGASVVTTLMIGLRFEVGGDWGAYIRMYNTISFLSLSDAFFVTDGGYALINWISAQADLGVPLVNFACAVIFVTGYGYLCSRQPNPALAVLIGVPYLIIVVAMGYTRQAAAIGMICFAIANATEQRLVRLVFFIGIAALLHKTAILMLPVALYPIFRRNLLLGAIGLGFFAVLFMLILRGSSDTLITNYIKGDMDSQGALIRISMNVLAAMIFILLRSRVELPPFQKSFWTVCSVLSLISLPVLFSGIASSGIDRLSLYLIPLQTIIYSRLPYILSQDRRRSQPSIIIAIIGYSALVQFIWLNYAAFSYYWIPYRNIILM